MVYQFRNVSPATANVMRANKKRNTKPELILRKKLFKQGFRYRIHYNKLPGNPDIVFPAKKVAIFCDGDFWHGKDWEIRQNKIKTNREYWIPKISNNIERDKNVTKKLESRGWNVLRFWESDIKKNINEIITIIERQLKK